MVCHAALLQQLKGQHVGEAGGGALIPGVAQQAHKARVAVGRQCGQLRLKGTRKGCLGLGRGALGQEQALEGKVTRRGGKDLPRGALANLARRSKITTGRGKH